MKWAWILKNRIYILTIQETDNIEIVIAKITPVTIWIPMWAANKDPKDQARLTTLSTMFRYLHLKKERARDKTCRAHTPMSLAFEDINHLSVFIVKRSIKKIFF